MPFSEHHKIRATSSSTLSMLSRRLLLSTTPASSIVRSFSTSVSLHKAPSLADVTPNGASSFDARQHEFRESQRAALKAKEQQDSQFVKSSERASTSSPSSSGPPTAQESSDASGSLVSDVTSKRSLGSLSTANTGAAREKALENESTKRRGPLANIIYGTKEGQQMDQEIERSFSQVLARGKYVHSIVFHQVKPDKVDDYVELVGKWYPRMASIEENHVHLVGSWRTEVGDCDTFGDPILIPSARLIMY